MKIFLIILAVILLIAVVVDVATLLRGDQVGGGNLTSGQRTRRAILAIVLVICMVCSIIGAAFAKPRPKADPADGGTEASDPAYDGDDGGNVASDMGNGSNATSGTGQSDSSDGSGDSNDSVASDLGDLLPEDMDVDSLDESKFVEGDEFPAIDLTKISQAPYEKYVNELDWESTALMEWWRQKMTGYSNAVGFSLFTDRTKAESLIGLKRDGSEITKSDLQLSNKEIKSALKKLQKSEKTAKSDFKKLDKLDQELFIRDRLYDQIGSNIQVLVGYYALFSSEEFFTKNNPWIIECYEDLMSYEDEDGGFFNLLVYEEGYKGNPAYARFGEKAQQYSFYMMNLLDSFVFRGKVKASSRVNLENLGGQHDGYEKLTFAEEQEKNRTFYEFDIISKQSGLVLRLGINPQDTRPALLATEKKVKKERKGSGGGGNGGDNGGGDNGGGDEPYNPPTEEVKTGTIIVQHLEQGTRKVLAQSEQKEGKAGKSFTFNKKSETDIPGYKFAGQSKGSGGTMTIKVVANKTIYESFYYVAKKESPGTGTVTGIYKDEAGNKIAQDAGPYTVEVGSKKSVSAKNLSSSGYTFQYAKINGTGRKYTSSSVPVDITEKGQTKTVVFVYKKNTTTTVTEKYFSIHVTEKYSNGNIKRSRYLYNTYKEGEPYSFTPETVKDYTWDVTGGARSGHIHSDLELLVIYTPIKPDGEGAKNDASDPSHKPENDQNPGVNDDPTSSTETNITEKETTVVNRDEVDKKNSEKEQEAVHEQENGQKTDTSGKPIDSVANGGESPGTDEVITDKSTGDVFIKEETKTDADGNKTTVATEIPSDKTENNAAVTDNE